MEMDLEWWLTTLTERLGIEDAAIDRDATHTLLDLARDAAHQVERIAAPLTTYLIGVAVGRGASLGEVAAQATALVTGQPAPSDPAAGGSAQNLPD